MSEDIKNSSDIELYNMLRTDKKTARIAFDELYLRYSKRIYTYCRKILNNVVLADDVFQEVFLQLHQVGKAGQDIKNISGFLITMARNRCLNENMRIANTFSTLDDVEISYSDDLLEREELKKIVNLSIDALPDQYKEVIIMKEHMDMSYNEIATALNLSISSVRIRIYRAKEKLRAILVPFLKDLQD